jgi:hypothetical protein
MNTRLPRILALSFSAIVLLVMLVLTLKEYHAAAMWRNLVLIIFFGATVVAVGIAFALGWLVGSVSLYIKSRQLGMSGKDIPVNRAGMTIAFLIVSLSLLIWGWYAYKSHLEHKIFSPTTSAAELDDLAENYLVNRTPHLKAYLAQHRSVSSTTLARLYASEDVQVRKAVCRNPHVGLDVMVRCAAETDTQVLLGVAGNSSTPQPILARLSHHDDYLIRAAVGFNAKTNPSILEQLSRDKNMQVRASILYHPELPLDILKHLASDPDRLVRLRVAANVRTPIPVQLRLASDPEEMVRWSLLRPQAPGEVLDILVKDQSERIRRMAKRFREHQ